MTRHSSVKDAVHSMSVYWKRMATADGGNSPWGSDPAREMTRSEDEEMGSGGSRKYMELLRTPPGSFHDRGGEWNFDIPPFHYLAMDYSTKNWTMDLMEYY